MRRKTDNPISKSAGQSPLFGSHLSIAGGMTNALDEAARLGLDSVQVFTKNQQQWKTRPLADDEVGAWRARVAELGWTGAQTVSHASYLINLASPDDVLWGKSIDLMTVEIERCEALGIAFLVHHPGAFTTSTREAGLARIIDAYAELFRRTRGFATVSCLENTVGSGSNLGGKFEELGTLRAGIIGRTGQQQRIGFCIDTCHAHASGYDLSTAESAAAAIEELDAACGLRNIRVLHLNDSKAPCGSRRDRHEHIGKGTIGRAGFAAVVNHAGLRDRPMIMETPKGTTPGGTPLDTLNLRKLRQLAGLRSGERTRGGVRAS
ncbi:MAG: deoxyribonuclease IV [Phycisphaeraceae bacterium]|nr:deoxyribonuclease IV [Phycisphaeraceae bacterium]